MKKVMWYDRDEDVLGVQLFEGDYWKSIELPDGIVIDVAKDGKIIAIEIANAKKVFSKAGNVLETAAYAQAR